MRHHDFNSVNSALLLFQSIPHNATIILGFSGGPDSVGLLHLLMQLKPTKNIQIIAAHLDHQWRTESGQDALWCKQFCDQHNISFISQKSSQLSYEPRNNGSKEETGRLLRRHFLENLAREHNAYAITLAHHQDDQIETFFIRLLRGSSIAGLAGMKVQDRLYFRPLLHTTKQDILNYLKHHNLPYLTDASNESKAFLRNRIRHDLLGNLSAIDARWDKTIPSCMQRLQQTNEFIEQQAAHTMLGIAIEPGSDKINTQMFLKLHQVLQHQILMNLLIKHKYAITPSTKFFNEIIRFLQSNKHQQHNLHSSACIKKKQNYFYFSSL